MREILDNLVYRFGGPNALAEFMHRSYMDGSESYRQRTVSTLLILDAAIRREAAAEKLLLARKIKAGMADRGDLAKAMGVLSEDELVVSMCESIEVLMESDLYEVVLQKLKERRSPAGKRLAAIREAMRRSGSG